MKEPAKNQFVDSIDECVTNGINQGILHLSTKNDYLDGRLIKLRDKDVVNFGSCSYLGLEVDERLKKAAIDAVTRFGTQFSSSRFYISCGLYVELEQLISEIFGAYALVAPSTSVAHAAAIPIVINDNDAIILDHQAHASMQSAVNLLTRRGITVEIIKHNNMQMLEDKIKELSGRHYRVWYMADSVYSMYGDYAPLLEIKALLEKYSQLYYYVDDAHGMSCTGKNGSGYITQTIGLLPKMILTSSMAKGFGTGGGILASLDKEIIRKVKTCGSNLIFSGPIQPPMLGASIASAKIHLSNEVTVLQSDLKKKIEYCDQLIRAKKLPYVFPSGSPIMYLALGLPKTGYNMINRLMEEGFYVDTGLFPAVSIKRTGIRIPINVNQRFEDIEKLIAAIEYHYPLVLAEEKQSIGDLSQHFNLDFSYAEHLNPSDSKENKKKNFDLTVYNSINELDKATWDQFFEDRGSFDWEGCKFLEDVFVNNPNPENNWNFYYFVVKDGNGKIILITFFTLLLCKDDMLSPESISTQIEEIRKNDPYYLTSKIMMMGSLLSEGEHLFVDRTNPHWKDALVSVIEKVRNIQTENNANAIYLRDFHTNDIELRDFLIGQGFFRTDMPDSYQISEPNFSNDETLLDSLSFYSKRHVKRHVLKYRDIFSIKENNDEHIEYWNELYANVKAKSLKFNTFTLPKKIFEIILKNPHWHVLELYLDIEESSSKSKPQAVIFSYSNKKIHVPMFIGLDYTYNSEFKIYRQALYRTICHGAKENKRIYLGMEAGIEKGKFGATAYPKCNYIQVNESFNMELLSLLSNQKNK